MIEVMLSDNGEESAMNKKVVMQSKASSSKTEATTAKKHL